MKKRAFSQRRLGKKVEKESHFWLIVFGILATLFLLLFLFLIPLFRLASGSFSEFVPYTNELRKANILVLLQNEAELRPTGGFLSGFILFTPKEKERLHFFDSYAVANPPIPQKAPPAMAKIFAEDPKFSGMVFRDSNFSPDFSESAQETIRFLRFDPRFANTKIDVVVAVNFSAVESVIQLLDPQDSQDLFLSLQRQTKNINLHSKEEIDQRKDFLGDMAHNLFRSASWFRLPKMAQLATYLADTKKIQVWFLDEKLQHIAQEKGWTGEFPKNNTAEMPWNGFFGVNVANLGGKKSDRYILRNVTSEITLSPEGGVSERFAIHLQHTGTDNIFSGPERMLIRVYHPQGTKLSETSEEWEQQSLPEEKVEEFSRVISLDPGQSLEIPLVFVFPETWLPNESHELLWLQQSGTEDDLTLIFRGVGETGFSVDGCDESLLRENISVCKTRLSRNRIFTVKLLPDTFPPFLEQAIFEPPREIFARFSEALAKEFSPDTFELRCDENVFVPYQLARNENDLRDVRLVFGDIVLSETSPFCELSWKNLSDIFGNTASSGTTLRMKFD